MGGGEVGGVVWFAVAADGDDVVDGGSVFVAAVEGVVDWCFADPAGCVLLFVVGE